MSGQTAASRHFTQPTTQESPDNSHQYHVINLYGNSRALIGSAYGSNLDNSSGRQTQEAIPSAASSPGQGFLIHFAAVAINILAKFDAVRAAIKALHKREKKVGKWAVHLGTRRIILKNAVTTFLLPSVGADTAEQMLLNYQHSVWATEDFLRYLHARLEPNPTPLQQSLEAVYSTLCAIADFLREGAGSAAPIPAATTSRLLEETTENSRRGRLLKRETFTSAVKQLDVHTSQSASLLQQYAVPQERTHVSEPTVSSKMKVGRYQRVQEAARDLYYAFGSACGEHTKHRARLRIHAYCETPSRVQFILVLEQSGTPQSGVHARGSPTSLKLTIESQVSGAITTAVTPLERVRHAPGSCASKRKVDDPDDKCPTGRSTTIKQKKTVSFAPPMQAISLPAVIQRNGPDHEFPNFCSHGNFCVHIRRLLSQGCANSRPLGYMHNSFGLSKHLIYLKSRSPKISLESTAQLVQRAHADFATLRSICQKTASRPKMSKARICSFATQLAVAVLQYHTTPWLERSWDSDHILIGDGEATTVAKLGSLSTLVDVSSFDSYLDVSITGTDTSSRTPDAESSRTLIRNWTLFNLGVMLLELAYRRPLRSMRDAIDLDTHSEHNTDYYTADRLQKRVSTKMGDVYAEVVRKCIQCDFGLGSDLSLSKLQEGYYEDVVQKLEDIETSLKKLGI